MSILIILSFCLWCLWILFVIDKHQPVWEPAVNRCGTFNYHYGQGNIVKSETKKAKQNLWCMNYCGLVKIYSLLYFCYVIQFQAICVIPSTKQTIYIMHVSMLWRIFSYQRTACTVQTYGAHLGPPLINATSFTLLSPHDLAPYSILWSSI